MKLTELHIEGYRSLVNVTLPMRDLAVVIGPNGAGKTALLEVLHLLQQSAEGKLANYFEKAGGFSAVVSRLSNGKTLRLRVFISAPGKKNPYSYSIDVLTLPVGYSITEESLYGPDPEGDIAELLSTENSESKSLQMETKLSQARYWSTLNFRNALISGQFQTLHKDHILRCRNLLHQIIILAQVARIFFPCCTTVELNTVFFIAALLKFCSWRLQALKNWNFQ